MIPRSTIEEVKARVDLAELISSYGIDLKSAGADDFKACCPFHQEKTPSFHVHPSRGYYHCFGCGESGNVFSFLMKHQGWGFMDSLKYLAEKAGVKLEEREDPNARLRQRLMALHAEIAAFFHRCLLQTKEAAAAREYCKARNLSAEICEAFTIGYVPQSPEVLLTWARKYGFTPQEMAAAGILLPPKYQDGRWYNRFAGRVMFSIADKAGRIVAFSGRTLSDDKKIAKYVNSPETPVFKKSSILFALDKAARAITKAPRREAIVCEGQIDVIRCHACGFDRAIASQGTSFTEEHAQILSQVADSVVLLFDADKAGVHAAVRTAGIFLQRAMPVRIATLPEGEDPDSFLRAHPPADFQAVLDAAESPVAFQIRTLAGEGDVVFAAREVMGLLNTCSSAVMKEALVNEAAQLLKIAPSALYADMRMHPAASRPARREQPSRDPEQEFIDEEEARYLALEEAERAIERETGVAGDDPKSNAPDALDMDFCNFLFAHERDGVFADDAAAAMRPELFSNPFTRAFASAWKESLASGEDVFANLRNSLDATARGWFDKIVASPDKTAVSELAPQEVFRNYLRRYWCEAIKMRRMRLSPRSEEDQLQSLRLTKLAKDFRQKPWEKLLEMMNCEL